MSNPTWNSNDLAKLNSFNAGLHAQISLGSWGPEVIMSCSLKI